MQHQHQIAPNLPSLKRVSIAKGLGFVVITALTLWWLLIDPDDGRILDANAVHSNLRRAMRNEQGIWLAVA